MPTRPPADDSEPWPFAADVLRRLDDVERRIIRVPEGEDTILQVYEDGEPLGDVRHLDFGPGVLAEKLSVDWARVTGQAAGGSRWGTVVVAASDTHAAGKEQADFVCDGTGDQATLDLALDAAPAGGEIVLLEGTYNTTAVWTIDTAGIHVRGMGMKTILSTTAASDAVIDVSNDDVRLSNFYILKAGGNPNFGVNVTSDNHDDFQMQWVFVDGTFSNDGVRVRGTRWRVENCRFLNCVNGIHSFGGEVARGVVQGNIIVGGSGSGIYLEATGSGRIAVLGNLLLSTGIAANTDWATVIGNIVQLGGSSPINCSGSDCVIAANVVTGSGAGVGINAQGARSAVTGNRIDSVTGDGINLADDCTCVGNVIRSAGNGGIVAGNGFGSRSTISGNTISLCGKQGIDLGGTDDAMVLGNTIFQCGQTADNTYDGIHVVGDRNDIQSNTVRQGPGANDHRYGIFVEGVGSSDNLVCNNDLFDSAQTAAFNDTGTNTRSCTSGGPPGGGGGVPPTTADYLVGTANADLSAEIVVGTTPGGQLNNTWASPNVDDVHGTTAPSSHADFIANALVDAKGDILTATADNTPVRKAVGADGTALVASAAAGDGLVWGTPAVLNFAAATTFGTVVGKVEIFDAAGASLGFLPVYDAIT